PLRALNRTFPFMSGIEIEEIPYDEKPLSTQIEMRRRTSSPNRLHPILLENMEKRTSCESYITFVRSLEQRDCDFCVRGAGRVIPDAISGDLRTCDRRKVHLERLLTAVEQALRLPERVWNTPDNEKIMDEIVKSLVKVAVSPLEYWDDVTRRSARRN
ncbi:hypothetical protein Trydic_g18406, partial [Trypoxylus dichotomus]